jgi:hypothetical protein
MCRRCWHQAEAAQSEGDYADRADALPAGAELDPGNLTALSYSGYLIALNGQRDSGSVQQVNDGMELIADRRRSSPEYADAHCLLALASHYFVDDEDDRADDQTEGEQCLALDPRPT